jgi:hypothetical protein
MRHRNILALGMLVQRGRSDQLAELQAVSGAWDMNPSCVLTRSNKTCTGAEKDEADASTANMQARCDPKESRIRDPETLYATSEQQLRGVSLEFAKANALCCNCAQCRPSSVISRQVLRKRSRS